MSNYYNQNAQPFPGDWQKKFLDGTNNGGNDSYSPPLYQRVGKRTALIHRLMNRQWPAADAEALANALHGNPKQGGEQNG